MWWVLILAIVVAAVVATTVVVRRRPPAVGRPADEDVVFTVYRPEILVPGRWATVLAFAHKTELTTTPDGRSLDPFAEVRAQAVTLLGEAAERERIGTPALAGIPRGRELRFVPEVFGVTFNPPSVALMWEEPVHRCEFRAMAEAGEVGSRLRGELNVYLGPLVIGRVPLVFRIEDDDADDLMGPVSATAYRKIFPSYSHRDSAVVAQIRTAVETLGDRYLQDVLTLRSGETWSPRLEQLIEEADVFQLFWSSNSMRSPYVRQEWTHALSLAREGFVRPLYWEYPRPESPQEGLPPPELNRLHFSSLGLAASDKPVVCRRCGAENDRGQSFCGTCGSFMWETDGPDPSTEVAPESPEPPDSIDDGAATDPPVAAVRQEARHPHTPRVGDVGPARGGRPLLLAGAVLLICFAVAAYVVWIR